MQPDRGAKQLLARRPLRLETSRRWKRSRVRLIERLPCAPAQILSVAVHSAGRQAALSVVCPTSILPKVGELSIIHDALKVGLSLHRAILKRDPSPSHTVSAVCPAPSRTTFTSALASWPLDQRPAMARLTIATGESTNPYSRYEHFASWFSN